MRYTAVTKHKMNADTSKVVFTTNVPVFCLAGVILKILW